MCTILYIISFLFLVFCILTNSELSLFYASKGLALWFDKMIPALLPFMILSATLIRMGLTEGFTTIVYPVIRPVFRVSRNVCYVMLMGFMCGFPMGAKCVSDLYSRDKITREEASFLLAFCNNIGPVYFVSFALPTIGCTGHLQATVLGMYGIPLLYGVFLRYTKYREKIYITPAGSPGKTMGRKVQDKNRMLLPALDEAIYTSLQSIAMLGGYMILFNLLMMIPQLYMPKTFRYIAPLLEITGGLSILKGSLPIYSLLVLPFGGLSCIAQTYTCIRNTDLSLPEYVLHKIILTVLTLLYYLLLRFLRLW